MSKDMARKEVTRLTSQIERLERELKYARECNKVKDKYWHNIGVERNTLKERVEELETELYFCYRNKRVGEVVDERTKVETR
jgi:archaellum component FlaC